MRFGAMLASRWHQCCLWVTTAAARQFYGQLSSKPLLSGETEPKMPGISGKTRFRELGKRGNHSDLHETLAR
jgi:hypothetical protein